MHGTDFHFRARYVFAHVPPSRVSARLFSPRNARAGSRKLRIFGYATENQHTHTLSISRSLSLSPSRQSKSGVRASTIIIGSHVGVHVTLNVTLETIGGGSGYRDATRASNDSRVVPTERFSVVPHVRDFRFFSLSSFAPPQSYRHEVS